MKKINSQQLLDSLQADVRQIILQACQLQHLSTEYLERQPDPNGWSIAQVLEHLNFYSRHYIMAIEKSIHLNQSRPGEYFSPGWLGDYFTRLMKPGADNSISKKMKAPGNALPSARPEARQVLDEFIQWQHQLITLLQISRSVNLESIRIPTSLNKMLKLKLGDTFRFYLAHEQRHFVQIRNILKVFHLPFEAAA